MKMAQQRNDFFMVSNELIRSGILFKLSKVQADMLLYLEYYKDQKTGWCYHTLETMREKTGHDRKVIQKSLKVLERRGLIESRRTGKRFKFRKNYKPLEHPVVKIRIKGNESPKGIPHRIKGNESPICRDPKTGRFDLKGRESPLRTKGSESPTGTKGSESPNKNSYGSKKGNKDFEKNPPPSPEKKISPIGKKISKEEEKRFRKSLGKELDVILKSGHVQVEKRKEREGEKAL